MELTNDFVIDRSIDETWAILNDLEFIAPCMPGAQLTEIEGEEYRGLVKIKVGPITANYKGKASFVEQDAVNHVARLKAEGRDPRQGNANAMVTATMDEVSATQTNVTIHTDLGLSGKIASFGRGAIEDVSKKLLGQFTDNLRDKLAAGGATAADSATTGTAGSPSGASGLAAGAAGAGAAATAAAGASSIGSDPSSSDTAASTPTSSASSTSTTGAAAAGSAADGSGSTPAAAAGSAAESAVTRATESTGSATTQSSAAASATGGVRKIDSPEAEAVDLLDVAGGAAAKRLVPAAGGLAVLAVIIWWVINR